MTADVIKLKPETKLEKAAKLWMKEGRPRGCFSVEYDKLRLKAGDITQAQFDSLKEMADDSLPEGLDREFLALALDPNYDEY